jgi:hypothetical protein
MATVLTITAICQILRETIVLEFAFIFSALNLLLQVIVLFIYYLTKL